MTRAPTLAPRRVARRRVRLAAPWPSDPAREIDVVLWRAGEPRALVVYSHGQDGRAAEVRDLARALARRGFLVAAPEHRDRNAAAARRRGEAGDRGDVHARFAYRPADLRRTLDHLLERWPRRPAVLVGFSLGAYAVLVVAGLPPGLRDERARALALLSPAVFPFDDAAFDALTVPSLSLYGERERAVARGGVGRWERALRIQDRLGAPGKMGELTELAGAGHLDFVRRRPLRDVLPAARRHRQEVARRVIGLVERAVADDAG